MYCVFTKKRARRVIHYIALESDEDQNIILLYIFYSNLPQNEFFFYLSLLFGFVPTESGSRFPDFLPFWWRDRHYMGPLLSSNFTLTRQLWKKIESLGIGKHCVGIAHKQLRQPNRKKIGNFFFTSIFLDDNDITAVLFRGGYWGRIRT